MRTLRWMYGKTTKDGIRNECIFVHLEVVSIGDKLRDDLFEMVWICPMQASNNVTMKSFSMQVAGPSRKKGRKEDMDGSSKDRSYEGQPIKGFGSRWIGMEKQNALS